MKERLQYAGMLLVVLGIYAAFIGLALLSVSTMP